MLFWVTMRGRERTFSNPRDSAIVSTTSIRILLVALVNDSPLVGPTAPRFENNGIEPARATLCGYKGCRFDTTFGEAPTACAPPTPVVPLPHPKPNCTPISRA